MAVSLLSSITLFNPSLSNVVNAMQNPAPVEAEVSATNWNIDLKFENETAKIIHTNHNRFKQAFQNNELELQDDELELQDDERTIVYIGGDLAYPYCRDIKSFTINTVDDHNHIYKVSYTVQPNFVAKKIYPDGSVLVENSVAGYWKIFCPDGSICDMRGVICYPDGTIKMLNATIYPDGHTVYDHLD